MLHPKTLKNEHEVDVSSANANMFYGDCVVGVIMTNIFCNLFIWLLRFNDDLV